MKGIVLAAGMGKRLGSATYTVPKALVTIAEKPLLHYILRLCDNAKLDEIVVVGGYNYFQVEAAMESMTDLSTPIRLVQNQDFKLGNLVSVSTGLSHTSGAFILANVDHIYPSSLFNQFISNSRGITAACDFDRPLTMDDMKIRHNSENRLTAISKRLRHFDGGYIGMTTCSASHRTTYERAVEATFKRIGKHAVAEQVLETLIQWGENPSLHDASGHQWWEVDTQIERRNVERQMLIPSCIPADR